MSIEELKQNTDCNMCNRCKEFAESMFETDYQYCPICGEMLVPLKQNKQIFDKGYWEYLESLDSKSEEWKIICNLGKKWHDSNKDLDYELKKYMKW